MRRYLKTTVLVSFVLFLVGCAGKGLLLDDNSPEEIGVTKLLPENTETLNPTFIVIGDTQSGHRVIEKCGKKKYWTTWRLVFFPYWIGNGIIGGINYLRHAPDAGNKSQDMMRDVIYRDAKKYDVDFVLNTGDITQSDGRRPKHWIHFLKKNKFDHPLLDEIPYLPTIGNHDRVNDTTYGLPNYEAVFGYPQFYTVEFENAVLIVLDSDAIIDQYGEIEPDKQEIMFREWFVSGDNSSNPSWLEEQLENFSNKKYKIISMHHPPLTYGWHHKGWYKKSNGKNLVQKRRDLLNLLAENNVQVIFSGHEHIYQHNILKIEDENQSKENPAEDLIIHNIISSSGGVPLREKSSAGKQERFQQNYVSEGLNVVNLEYEKVFHYCLVSFDETGMKIDTYGVEPHGNYETYLLETIRIN